MAGFDEGNWRDIEIPAEGGPVLCRVGTTTAGKPDRCLLLVAHHGGSDDSAPSAADTPWVALDRLAALKIGVMIMGDGWGNLDKLAGVIRSGRDGFGQAVGRVRSVVHYCLQENLAPCVVMAGTSRHGFLTLLSTAVVPEIQASMAIQPVTYWPYLREFKGMEENSLIRKYDLSGFTHKYYPRPVYILSGYDDKRVGTGHCLDLAAKLARAYESHRGDEERKKNAADMPFRFETLPFAGHTTRNREELYSEVSDRSLGWLSGLTL